MANSPMCSILFLSYRISIPIYTAKCKFYAISSVKGPVFLLLLQAYPKIGFHTRKNSSAEFRLLPHSFCPLSHTWIIGTSSIGKPLEPYILKDVTPRRTSSWDSDGHH